MKSTAIVLSIALSFTGALPVFADEPHAAQGIFCETLEQAERFLTAYDGTNRSEALEFANNGLTFDEACGSATILVQQEEEFHQYENKLGLWQLVKVRVLAEQTQFGMRPLPPDVFWFTAFRVEKPILGTSI